MTTIIIILAALTLLLGILEIFFFPGFGLAGIGSVICALADIFFVYHAYGWWPAVGAVAIGLLLLGAMLWWVARSRTIERMALRSAITSTNATEAQLSVRVGDRGRALTRLALVGNADFDGKLVEVKSSGAFIDPGTPVRVVSVSEANVTVEAAE